MSFGSLVPYVRSVSGPRNAWGTPGSRRAADDRARSHRELLVAEQAHALAVEHDEELLLGSVTVRRAIELAFRDYLVAHAGLHGARRATQIAGLPRAVG